jgi:outer membrane protein OmpA-like peptidoglycan-associated protein
MTSTMKSLSLAAGLALLLASPAAGCAAVEPGRSALGPSLPKPGADQEYEVNFPDPGHGSARYIRISIDEDLSKSCGLMRTYFAFDSDKLSPLDQATLRNVAACLERPELKGMRLSIVGRADSRGNAEYNVDLGLRRAESVKELLIGAGIAEGRIGIASPGETGAVGTDKPEDTHSYGYDRRVDVVLMGVTHTPR